MSFIQLYIHCVWGTKYREPVLEPGGRGLLLAHIRETAQAKKIGIDVINGYYDHIHCLLSLPPVENLSKALQLLKGESAHWANRNAIFPRPLVWAKGYYAASIDLKSLSAVRSYILTQEEHHGQHFFMENQHFRDTVQLSDPELP